MQYITQKFYPQSLRKDFATIFYVLYGNIDSFETILE